MGRRLSNQLKTMAKIVIRDTGYLTTNKSGTPRSGTDINNLGTYLCNSGTGITLTSSTDHFQGGTNLSAEPNPGSNAPTRMVMNTFENDIYRIPFIINSRLAAEYNLIKELAVFYKTDTIKLIYPSASADIKNFIVELIGRTNTKFNTSDLGLVGIPVLVCKCIGLEMDARPTKYAFKGTLTFKEEPVVTV